MRWTFHGICNVCQYEQYVCVYPKSGNFRPLNFRRVFFVARVHKRASNFRHFGPPIKYFQFLDLHRVTIVT